MRVIGVAVVVVEVIVVEVEEAMFITARKCRNIEDAKDIDDESR